jgi:hypothetical protein
MYGESFTNAASLTWNMLASCGLTAVINDDLTGIPLTCGTLICGLASATIVVVVFLAQSYSTASMILLALIAFLVGIFVASTALGVIASAVSTTYVCWTDSPRDMAICQSQHFLSISESLKSYYNNVYVVLSARP